MTVFRIVAAACLCTLIWCTCARADEAGYLYLYALHDSHAADTFFSADATKPVGPEQPVRPYFELLLQRDTRTVRGVLPQTLNDNFGLAAGGVQYEGSSGLRVFAQVGSTFNFGPPTPVAIQSHFDVRGGMELYRDWSDKVANPRRNIGSFFAAAIYYNRYENGIFYFEAERGHECGRSSNPFQLFGRLSGSADTRRYYYNNAVSLTAGLRFLPLGRRGPALGVEESYSSYVGPTSAIEAAGVTRHYTSFRPVVTFAASF